MSSARTSTRTTRRPSATRPADRTIRRDVMGLPVALRDLDLDTFFAPRSVAVVGASDSDRRPNTALNAFEIFREDLALASMADKLTADVDGVLVAQQVQGTETVVGIARDELFGPVVMFGLGGVLIEVLRDVTFRVPPFSPSDAARMLDELAGSVLLRGLRGRPPADRRALVDVIMAVQRLAVDLADEVAELDVNPLLAGPSGAVAADALVVLR